jgi:predicted peroxiredoxin
MVNPAFESELKRLKERQDVGDKLVDIYLQSKKVLEHGQIAWSETSLMRVYAHISVERLGDFTTHFMRMCRQFGVTVSMCETVIDVVEVASIKQTIKVSKTKIQAQDLTDSQTAHIKSSHWH